MADNSKALENGFNKAKQIIRERVEIGLMAEANKLAMKAYEMYHSPKMAFTGQTWTGTAVGAFSGPTSAAAARPSARSSASNLRGR